MTWLLYIFSFASGVGFYAPFVNLYKNFSIFDVIIVFFLLLFLFRHVRIPKSKEGKALGFLIFLFVSWEFLSLFMSPIKEWVNIGPIVRLAYYGVIIFIGMGAIRKERNLRIMVYLFLLGILMNLIGSTYLWTLSPRYWFGLPMIDNEFINRNSFYYYLVFALPFALCLARLTRKKITHFLAYLWSIIITIVAFLSFSRGAWVILGMVWGIYGILRTRKILIPLLMVGLIVVGLFGTGVVQFENIQKGVEARLMPDALAPSFLRIDFFRISWEMGINHFLFGVGVRNFRHLVSDYHDIIRTRDPHNTYAMIFAETGFLGLVFYLTILGSVIWWFLKFRKKACQNKLLRIHWESGALLILVVLALNMVTGVLFTDKIFPFFLLYIAGITRVARMKKIKNN